MSFDTKWLFFLGGGASSDPPLKIWSLNLLYLHELVMEAEK